MTMRKKGAKIGRPRAKVDMNVVDAMSRYQFTNADIADYFGVSERTIERIRAENKACGRVDLGRLKGRVSVRKLLFDKALGGDIAAIIFLNKTVGGLRERNHLELSGPNGLPVSVAAAPALDLSKLTDQELEEFQRIMAKAKNPEGP